MDVHYDSTNVQNIVLITELQSDYRMVGPGPLKHDQIKQ